MEMIPVLTHFLVKSFGTLCPHCITFLGVSANDLRLGKGMGHCGECSATFNVVPELVELYKRKPRRLLTVCPGCQSRGGAAQAAREITVAHLRGGEGKLQCSSCSTVFDVWPGLHESAPTDRPSDGKADIQPPSYWKDSNPQPPCPKCGSTHEPGGNCISGSITGSISAGTPLAPASSDQRPRQSQSGGFELAGRPMLERFLREHVIDIVQNPGHYQALGVEFPGAIVLHGPPGCGKTYAVDRLIEFLGWPNYRLEASNIGSPYIHETSMKVAAIFNEATKNAPSVIVIDEMDAFLPRRQTAVGSGQHAVEEVAEFLRRIPEAGKRRVLIVGMTNELGLIDPAVLRRGRFDHVVEVPMATETEIASLLKKLFTGIPVEPGVKIGPIARQLCGRPLSDVSFVVKEAARLAALHRQSQVGEEMMSLALQRAIGA